MIRTPLVVAAAMAVSALASVGHAEVIKTLTMDNHPDGNAAPPFYGLRLDNILGSGTATFDIVDGTLTVEDNGGDLSINIVTRVFGGTLDSSGGYIDGAFYDIEYAYTQGIEATDKGWKVTGMHDGNSGLMSEVGGDTVIELGSKPNGSGLAFSIQANGHRLDNDTTTWVGYGWLLPVAGGAQDWLFTATDSNIPTPGSTALLATAGIIAARRRRK
ncbi:MAG: hypothetical protein AAGB34_03535 [Planctomycetota bacterium]